MFLYFKKHPWVPVIIVFLIAEAIIDPIGEFCLNDDWAYAKTVENILTTGELRFSFWQGMPALPLLYVGVVFSHLFGFSFSVLRLISVLSVVIITLIFHSGLKRAGVNTFNRFAVLMLFVFNPLTISLGNSFLTDIFQLVLGISAFQFMIVYLLKNRMYHFFLFILFSLFASLNRQTGIVIPFIFAILFVSSEKLTLKRIACAISPLIICFIGLVIFEYLAKSNGVLPANYNLQFNNLLSVVSHPTFNNIKIVGYYFITSTVCLGLFILPFTICNLKNHYSAVKKSLKAKLILIVYLGFIIIKLWFSGNIFPFVGNMFYHLGTGPVILTGFNTQDIPELPLIIKIMWISLNIIGGLSFFMSMIPIMNKQKTNPGEHNFSRLFFIMLLVFYLVPLCFSYANDRYLLFLIPFYFMGYIISIEEKINKWLFIIVFSPIFYFSIASTHDYLALNKARWKATDYLVKQNNVPPKNIDGGFEFNGWHAIDTKNYIPSHEGRWWFVDKDDYVISPSKLDGYSIESTFGFSSWMSFEVNELFVLKKQ